MTPETINALIACLEEAADYGCADCTAHYCDDCDVADWRRVIAQAKAEREVPKVCANCKHYNSKRQYCGVSDATICRAFAEDNKVIGCEKWEAK